MEDAHLLGVQEISGSNPDGPTNFFKDLAFLGWFRKQLCDVLCAITRP